MELSVFFSFSVLGCCLFWTSSSRLWLCCHSLFEFICVSSLLGLEVTVLPLTKKWFAIVTWWERQTKLSPTEWYWASQRHCKEGVMSRSDRSTQNCFFSVLLLCLGDYCCCLLFVYCFVIFVWKWEERTQRIESYILNDLHNLWNLVEWTKYLLEYPSRQRQTLDCLLFNL